MSAKIPRYLVDAARGPILSPLRGQYDISFACITYLVTSIDLLDSTYYPVPPLLRTGEGFHSLQLYANTFWLEHFLDLVSLHSNVEALAAEPIMEQFHHLRSMYGIYPRQVLDKRIESAKLDDPRLDLLKDYPNVHTFLHQILVHCQTLSKVQLQAKGIFPP
jgi:hypothetical protein